MKRVSSRSSSAASRSSSRLFRLSREQEEQIRERCCRRFVARNEHRAHERNSFLERQLRAIVSHGVH